MTQKPKSDKSRILKSGGNSSEEPSTHWGSIYVATLLSFIGSVQFNLYFSSLWPYIQILDHGTTENFFGLTVVLYSLGQIIASYFFGVWSNRLKQVRQPLCTGLCLMFFGNAIYIFMETIHLFHKRYLLLLSRFVIGMGSANSLNQKIDQKVQGVTKALYSKLRSYASTASTADDRTKAISFVTAGQALGLVIGPVFQLAFTSLEYPGYRLFASSLSLNLYTSPAYLACFMNMLGLLLLFTLFKENYAGIIEDDASDDQSSASSTTSALPAYDKLASFICYLTRFTDMFVRTNLEVLGSPLAMMFFALNETQAVKTLAITQGFVGALTLLVYFFFIFFKLERFVQLRTSCIAALAALIVFHVLTFSYPFLPDHVALTSELNTTDDAIGCNAERFEWCYSLTTVPIWLFYGSYSLIIGLSFPLLTLTMNSLFSKILGPRRQGKQQGLLQVSSGVARMAGPLAASNLYSGFGPRPVWILEILVITVTLSTWGVFYKRMVPLKVPDRAEIAASISSPMDTKLSKNKVHPV
ncbi:hypothetical protein M3Y97_00064600 [Aphelenchoides bicaudatus]|nr:hypothetical protein M3Y97_00064600 [Aphelenchoides bicaudatus]